MTIGTITQNIIKVAAIDNHRVIIDGLAATLSGEPDFDFLGGTRTIGELIDGPLNIADVVLLDLLLPDDPNPETNIRRLVDKGIRVLIYTSEERPFPVRQAIKAGASGLLLKDDEPDTVPPAIREAQRGEIVFSGELANELLNDPNLVSNLSPMQIKILKHIDRGLKRDQIASKLFVTRGSVGTYLKRIGDKYLDRGYAATNAHDLTNRARREGYLDRDPLTMDQDPLDE